MPNAQIRIGNPLKGAIEGYSHPEKVCAIVNPIYGEYDLVIFPADIYFLGYREMCEKHLQLFPNQGIIVNNIQNKII